MSSPGRPWPADDDVVDATTPTAVLVTRYAEDFHRTMGHASAQNTVTSPLAVWLMLALSAPAATGAARARLEAVLGTTATDAHHRAGALLADPHPAVAAAIALWTRAETLIDTFTAFSGTLPGAVDQGTMPTQEEADAWALEHSAGRIETFPVEEDTFAVFASALATKVAWRESLGLVGSHRLGGPFAAKTYGALRSSGGLIVETQAAGLVAVTSPQTHSQLNVYSVIASASFKPGQVLEAAYEVGELLAHRPSGAGTHNGVVRARVVNLYDLDEGPYHAWTVTESKQRRSDARRYAQEFEAYLPAWDAATELDIQDAPGVAEVGETLGQFSDDRPGFLARQVATASYSQDGCEAAAGTTAAVTPAPPAPTQGNEVTVRRAEIRFNRPHAVVAVATIADLDSGWAHMPVFAAWVEAPTNIEAPPPEEPTRRSALVDDDEDGQADGQQGADGSEGARRVRDGLRGLTRRLLGG